eukprot:Tbor_TRINITY_DN5680_c0_g3::TRINITY_DN5680_c0_g3_i1::g.9030::m.9030/K03236/EIF1A; translation initiation factor 1A
MGAGNKGKGGKAFRSGKGGTSAKRELVVKEDELESYARIRKHLGCGMLECLLTDGTTCIGKVRGSMARNQKPTKENTVLVSKREFEDGKVDILHLYKDEEVKELVKIGELPSDFQTVEEREESTIAAQSNAGYTFISNVTRVVDETDAMIMEEYGKVVEFDPLNDIPHNRLQGDLAEEDADLDDI